VVKIVSSKKAFFDSNIFIYLIEENLKYLPWVHNLMDFLETHDYEIITSTLSLGELLTKPYKENRLDLVKKYKELLANIEMVELNCEIADSFSKIRAQYSIKTPDAIQLASALHANAQIFISNDEKLLRWDETPCKVHLLKEYR